MDYSRDDMAPHRKPPLHHSEKVTVANDFLWRCEGGELGKRFGAACVAVRGPVDARTATRWIGDACDGVAALHAAGMMHRDIKPEVSLRRARSGYRRA